MSRAEALALVAAMPSSCGIIVLSDRTRPQSDRTGFNCRISAQVMSEIHASTEPDRSDILTIFGKIEKRSLVKNLFKTSDQSVVFNEFTC